MLGYPRNIRLYPAAQAQLPAFFPQGGSLLFDLRAVPCLRFLLITLSLEVRGEKAGDCEAGWEAITDILGNGALPSGIRLLRQSWEGLAWDAGTGRFLRRGSLGGSAYFIAERDAETAALLDFDLKGVVRI